MTSSSRLARLSITACLVLMWGGASSAEEAEWDPEVTTGTSIDELLEEQELSGEIEAPVTLVDGETWWPESEEEDESEFTYESEMYYDARAVLGEDEDGESGSVFPIALPTGEERSAVTPQSLSLPDGGGAIEGMGESFQALLSSGQATFSVPIALPGGRGGVGAGLSLSYSTGGGNSIAGVGWSVGVPFVAHQTDRGLPRYDSSSLDRFIYNGGQELVPITSTDETLMPEDEAWPAFVSESAHGWTYFRARIEGSFLRFFLRDDERQWIVQDTDGTLFVFGESGAGTGNAIVDFDDGGRTFVYRWNLSSVIDRSGNRAEYRYERDLGQSYLRHAYWTNPPGGASDADLESYQHHAELTYEDRPDPFFSYASGFRIETALRLTRIDVESVRFGGAPGSGYDHTRTYSLEYDTESELSLLASVQLLGRGCFDAAGAGCTVEDGGSLPAMRFEYTGLDRGIGTDGYGNLNDAVSTVGTSPPHSVSEERADFFDANADGLPDLIVTAPADYHGRHGLFMGRMNADREVFFEEAEGIGQQTSGGGSGPVDASLTLSNANINPMDMDGDGHVEYLHMPHLTDYQYYWLDHTSSDPLSGYVWREEGPFDPGDTDIDFSRDAERIRHLDVNNDHLVDIVRTAGTHIQTFLNAGRCPGGDGQFGTPEYDGWGACTGFSTEPITSCALYRGLPLDFSDPELQLADMNGDGLQDIVHLRRGDVAYWPGRGPGVWGEGSRTCEAGGFGDDREIVMADGPLFGLGAESLHLADVNGDGTADLIQVRFSDVDVWLNRGGYGWTTRYTVPDTPPHRDFANRIRLADLNGSGASDIVWGDAGDYRFLDLMGGEQPRLLEVIHNGLGGETRIFYRSSIDYQVDEELAGRPWESVAPMPVTVVAGTVSSDGLGWYGETEYEYRDAVYDGVEAEFRGFRQALARSIGDEHTPTAVAVSRFYTGERPDWLCEPGDTRQECALRDNPYEALKGSEVQSESRSDQDDAADPWNHPSAAYSSTAHSSYTVDRLFEGRDGRGVWLAWGSRSDAFSYRNDPFEPGASTEPDVPTIAVRDWLPGATGPDLARAESESVALRSGAGQWTHVLSTKEIDRFGRVTVEHSEGFVAEPGDETTSRSTWVHDPSSWIHRPCLAWVDGVAWDAEHLTGDASMELGLTQTFYDGADEPCVIGTRGLPTHDQVYLVTRQLSGDPHVVGWLPQTISVYNDQGLVTQSLAGVAPGDETGALRHAWREYDAQYGSAVTRERIQSNRPGGAYVELTTEATWDTGLGALTSLTDFNGNVAYVAYDALGRVRATFRPMCPEPSVVHDYVLDPAGALHHVHTRVNEVCDAPGPPAEPDPGVDPASRLVDASGVQEAYAFVDGLGRARAAISEGDPDDGFGWVLSGVGELDARGNVWKAYEPTGLAGGIDPVASVRITGLAGADFVLAGRDAFGRELWATNYDGPRAHETFYGARWTRVRDGEDIYNPEHGDTPSVAVADGLGRSLLSIATTASGGGSTPVVMARTTYDRLGNIFQIERGEGAVADGQWAAAAFVSGHTTTRHLLYDSLGRRTHNLDPDSGTSLYYYDRLGDLTRFVDGRSASSTINVESRFLYDMAGRLVAEDHGSDDASWAVTVTETGLNADDDAPLGTLTGLANELFAYRFDTDRDFVSDAGADVLYFFDISYSDPEQTLCRAGPGRTQENVLGALSWVRDSSGCTWSSYDLRGRPTWAARQIDPSLQVFVTESSYQGEAGQDDMDRVRAETYPDGTSVHYTYSPRGLLDRVTGEAPGSGWLFDNRTFVDDISYDEFGQRRWIRLGQAGENQIETSYGYDERRRMTSLASSLNPDTDDRTLILNEYHFDEVGNILSVLDQRTALETAGWSPQPVDYTYEYDPLYRLIAARPDYLSGSRPLDDPGTPDVDEERAGDQEWTHDALGSMQTWTAIEEVAGEHFHGWSLGTILNGHQLLENGSTTGISARCADITEADERATGPAPHALYFAYEGTGVEGEFEGVEACYDAAGNIVALFRLHLESCGAGPLNASSTDWSTACTAEEVWSLSMRWDAVGRLAEVWKQEGPSLVAHLLNVYDASNTRAIRLDLESTEGSDQATLYVSPGYEIRDAALQPDGTYLGGEETKYVYAGVDRIARVVERTVNGVLPWPNEPGEPYVFYTLTNHLGSAAVTVNAEQVLGQDDVIVAQTQLPYGADDALVENAAFAWRPDYEFTGKEEDPDVDLLYFGARFYSPGLGRWVSADPLAVHGLGADLNQYRYVNANPLVLIDPNGLEVGEGDGAGEVPEESTANEDPMSDVDNEHLDRREHQRICDQLAQAAGGNVPPMVHPTPPVQDFFEMVERTCPGAFVRGAVTGAMLAAMETVGFVIGMGAMFDGASNEELVQRWAAEDYEQQCVDPNSRTRRAVQTLCEMAGAAGGARGTARARQLAENPEAVFNEGGMRAGPGDRQTGRGRSRSAPEEGLRWGNPRSGPTYGHTFSRHGAGVRNTQRLTGRARTDNQSQGQWLNNQAAADWLAAQRSAIPRGQGQVDVSLPEGLGQVIRPDGTIVPATKARLIPLNPSSQQGGYRTAFPVE